MASGAKVDLGAEGWLRDFVTSSPTLAWCRCDQQGRVLAGNDALAKAVGRSVAQMVGTSLWDLVAADDVSAMATRLAAAPRPAERFLLNLVDDQARVVTLSCQLRADAGGFEWVGEPIEPEAEDLDSLVALTNELALLHRQHARRGRRLQVQKDRAEQELAELREGAWHLPKGSGVLDICAQCGKALAGDGKWQELIEFLRDSEVLLSHGYCPDCLARFLAGIATETTE